MDEFGLIERYFKPLSTGFSGSLNLSDDAAIISPPPGHELVITKDAISQGVHYLGHESPALIARKLLRTNLSDLAAMGATPLCYFLAVMLPKNTTPEWLESFAQGLQQDQKEFGIHLAGGDTIATLGTPSFSLTALGTVPAGKSLRRGGAQIGDIIYVSDTLGDSALGLMMLQKNIPSPALEQRYYLPEPRLALGQQLLGIAHAAMDISDGLLQDLGHICAQSQVGATLYRDRLPLSEATQALVHQDAALWNAVLSGGDDYELLFTAAPNAPIETLARSLNLRLTAIGEITVENAVRVLDENKNIISVPRKGFAHF
jgi:thiamine-monophosphate kinase